LTQRKKEGTEGHREKIREREVKRRTAKEKEVKR
jgi:hypothetical protein